MAFKDEFRMELGNLSSSVDDQWKRLFSPTHTCIDVISTIKHPLSPWIHHNTVNTQCSSLIPLPAAGKSVFVSYKYNEAYSNDERCLWTLDNTRWGRRVSSTTVRVTLVCEGFQGSGDALTLHERNAVAENNKESRYSSQKIRAGEVYERSGSLLYLAFTSDAAVTGTGFMVRIDVLATSGDLPGKNFVYSGASGSASYGPYENYDQASIVVTPSKHTQFRVTSVEMEICGGGLCTCDSLNLFQLNVHGNLVHKTKLCRSSDVPYSIYTNETMLAVFTSDNTSRDDGIRISWS